MELHRVNSRFWASVGFVVPPREEVRFVRERVAVGDETAALMGGSADRWLQLAGRWFAVARKDGIAPGMDDAARLRFWRHPVTRANHERFVAMALDALAESVRPERELRREWFGALEGVLGEFGWLEVSRANLTRYLRRSTARALRVERADFQAPERIGTIRTPDPRGAPGPVVTLLGPPRESRVRRRGTRPRVASLDALPAHEREAAAVTVHTAEVARVAWETALEVCDGAESLLARALRSRAPKWERRIYARLADWVRSRLESSEPFTTAELAAELASALPKSRRDYARRRISSRLQGLRNSSKSA